MKVVHFGRFMRLKLRLLGYLQRQCQHPSELVSVDIAEGSFETPVSWCRICGTVIIRNSKHEPRADWWIEESLEAQKRILEEHRIQHGIIFGSTSWPVKIPAMPKVESPRDSPSAQQMAECDCSRLSVLNPTCVWPACAEGVRRQ